MSQRAPSKTTPDGRSEQRRRVVRWVVLAGVVLLLLWWPLPSINPPIHRAGYTGVTDIDRVDHNSRLDYEELIYVHEAEGFVWDSLMLDRPVLLLNAVRFPMEETGIIQQTDVMVVIDPAVIGVPVSTGRWLSEGPVELPADTLISLGFKVRFHNCHPDMAGGAIAFDTMRIDYQHIGLSRSVTFETHLTFVGAPEDCPS